MSEIKICLEKISCIQSHQLEDEKRIISEFEAIALFLSEPVMMEMTSDSEDKNPYNYSV